MDEYKILSVEDEREFIGIQIYEHHEGEECYVEGGCSLMFFNSELEKAGIDRKELLEHPDHFVVKRGGQDIPQAWLERRVSEAGAMNPAQNEK